MITDQKICDFKWFQIIFEKWGEKFEKVIQNLDEAEDTCWKKKKK